MKSKTSSNSNHTTLLCSSQDRSHGSESTETISAAEQVYEIDLIREEIFKYAIFDSNGKICGKTVKKLRSVHQKCLLQTVTRLLRKFREPLIVLNLDGNNSSQDENANGIEMKGNMLDQLVETFGSSKNLQESFLPVKLNLQLEYFRERNYQSLADCLTRLGSDLVELQLDYPFSGGTMPSNFPPFSLPHLRKLSFHFSNTELDEDSDDEEDEEVGDYGNGLWLFQTILSASQNLKNLTLPDASNLRVVPMGFKFLRLPATISFLELGMTLKSKDLEVLLRNQLPHLAHLVLLVHKVPFRDGLLFKILEGLQKTLQTLEVNGLECDGHPTPHTLLRLPLMEKLWKLEICSIDCELCPGSVSPLQKCLPKLKVMRLEFQTKTRLAKWIENSAFENVKEVGVSLVNEQFEYDHESHFISPCCEILTQLHQAFPNVRTMYLNVNISDLTGLKSLFQNMVQLTTLRIDFEGNGTLLENSSDLIDSILLGLPLWMVVGLRTDMTLLETQAIVIRSGKQPSIRQLSELETLTLLTIKGSGTDPEGSEPRKGTLVSDLLFRHAFMKMAKLRNLHLYRKFQPSLEMQEEWERQGRFLKYYDL